MVRLANAFEGECRPPPFDVGQSPSKANRTNTSQKSQLEAALQSLSRLRNALAGSRRRGHDLLYCAAESKYFSFQLPEGGAIAYNPCQKRFSNIAITSEDVDEDGWQATEEDVWKGPK